MNKADNNHEILTAELLRKYRNGTLSPDEEIRVDTLRKQDPFAADALEGTSVATDGESFAVQVTALRHRLRKRTRQPRSISAYSVRVAASLVILLVASYLVYQYIWPSNPVQVAQEATATTTAPTLIDSPLAQLLPLPPIAFPYQRAAKKTAILPSVQPAPTPSTADAAPMNLAESEAPREETAFVKPLYSSEAEREAVAASPDQARSQATVSPRTRTISGKVLSEKSGELLPGVNVIAKGTQHGTITDLEGNYQLELPPDTETLAFSSIGFLSKEREVLPGQQLDVSLEADMQQLSEEVVVGNYKHKKHYAPATTAAQPQPDMRSFKNYLRDNAYYPDDLPDDGKKTVKLSFSVQEDGSLTDFEVEQSAGNRLDQEAIRLVREGPDWTAATLKGQSVVRQVMVKVRFKR